MPAPARKNTHVVSQNRIQCLLTEVGFRATLRLCRLPLSNRTTAAQLPGLSYIRSCFWFDGKGRQPSLLHHFEPPECRTCFAYPYGSIDRANKTSDLGDYPGASVLKAVAHSGCRHGNRARLSPPWRLSDGLNAWTQVWERADPHVVVNDAIRSDCVIGGGISSWGRLSIADQRVRYPCNSCK